MNCDRCKEMGLESLCFPLIAITAAIKSGDAKVIADQVKALENNQLIKDNCVRKGLVNRSMDEAESLAGEIRKKAKTKKG
jgi:hypothetical protein